VRSRLWLAAVAAVLVGLAFTAAGRVLVVADPLPAHADAIVVLAGSVADRTLEAAALYQTGLAPLVVVTRERRHEGESALRARGVELPESDALSVSALTRLGVPPSAIRVLRRRAISTETEARTIARYACARRLRSIVVVTSKAHSRRARMILRRTLGPGIAVAVRPSRWDTFTASGWSRVRRHAKTVLSEWEKLLNYGLVARWRIEPCGGLRRVSRPRPA